LITQYDGEYNSFGRIPSSKKEYDIADNSWMHSRNSVMCRTSFNIKKFCIGSTVYLWVFHGC